MSQPYYDSDLTNGEWEQIEPLLPSEKSVGKEREVDLRVVLNGLFYRADNGSKWRALPPEFGARQTVYSYFRLWVRLGMWEQINFILVQQVCLAAGREAEPSLAIINIQSAKLGQKGGKNTALMATRQAACRGGYVRTSVRLLCVAVNTADVKAAPAVLVWVLEQFKRIVKALADQGYRGDFGALRGTFFAEQQRLVEVELSQRLAETKGFQVEPKRWIVERTWTWLENARALTHDYE
jgi:transposase